MNPTSKIIFRIFIRLGQNRPYKVFVKGPHDTRAHRVHIRDGYLDLTPYTKESFSLTFNNFDPRIKIYTGAFQTASMMQPNFDAY